LGMSLEEAAEGILRISNANMAKAIRTVTVERGFDPREFSLIAFGGAGSLHAAALAHELQMPEVIVPPFPGVTSAMGLLFSDPLDDFSWAYVRRQEELDTDDMQRVFDGMEERVVGNLLRQGLNQDDIAVELGVDIRYVGQLHSVTVALAELSDAGMAAAIAHFHEEHRRQYSYAHPDSPVETSTLRVTARGRREKPDLAALSYAENSRTPLPERRRQVHFESTGWVETRVLDRISLSVGDELAGPCIVERLDTTIVLPPEATGRIDEVSNILITFNENKERSE
ncbi:MAG: N-methylhydantoinase, partial [Nocardioidaceae bacterium]|nr:N-methylhydantoinase [Nocardioidaceae bacterium]